MKTKRNFNLVRDVSRSGAPAGTILTGTIRSNAGLRLRILEDQPRGDWGPIHGQFVILDVGDNMHSEALKSLIGQVIDADTVLRVVRKDHPMCVNVVNAQILMHEGKPTARRVHLAP